MTCVALGTCETCASPTEQGIAKDRSLFDSGRTCVGDHHVLAVGAQ